MKLQFVSALQQIDLLAPSVKKAIQEKSAPKNVQVAEIDSQFMGGSDLCTHYGILETNGANCVIVEGTRGSKKSYAACLLPVSRQRADFNGVVRKHLKMRRVSLAPLDFVLEKTGMEYGSITIIGLPPSWSILIDPSLISQERVILGSGLQKSKLSLPGKALLDLPHAHVLENICKENIEC